jgi:ppGpp synthetase/RelA/SpoT-type nucleotidyltranferase
MISDEDVATYHATATELLGQVLKNLTFCLDKVLREAPDHAVGRTYARSRVRSRVKTSESLLRKLRRDRVDDLGQLPLAVEDLLGIRIVTPDKLQARSLFEWFRSTQATWFFSLVGSPVFTPYTFENTNKYSLKSGYQAFHITFVADNHFPWFPANRQWPCEIQIMAQVWEFWADYSRTYFYAKPDVANAALLPYSAAISKLLDAADDLMSETAKILLAPSPADPEPAVDEVNGDQAAIAIAPNITADVMRKWLVANIRAVFGEGAKVPNEFFIHKIVDELTLHNISLEQLDEILRNEATRDQYRVLLRDNGLSYLPVYQYILYMLLLSRSATREILVERLNSELRPLGIRLSSPTEL